MSEKASNMSAPSSDRVDTIEAASEGASLCRSDGTTPVENTSSEDVNAGQEEHGQKRTRPVESTEQEIRELEANGAHVVYECDEGDEIFFEIEAVLDRRVRRKRVEYLIKWKGCDHSENTWEPTDNLCDTALADAIKFARETNQRKKQMELGIIDTPSKDLEKGKTKKAAPKQKKPPSNPKDPVRNLNLPPKEEMDIEGYLGVDEEDEADALWSWNDAEHLTFRPVERLNVNDPHAACRAREARINGTPIVLVGHVGWANFAKRWGKTKPLKSEYPSAPCFEKIDGDEKKESNTSDSMNEHTQSFVTELKKEDELLDLSGASYELDIQRLIDDIGMEDVPIVRRNYDEEKPIHGVIKASKFLKASWQADTGDENQSVPADNPKLYLHQWQFPLSDTAGRNLCHNNNPLPNDIFGEDLLKYWLDLPQCKHDSPLQYLFMGREETMSKLHRDNGGLAITIAPIVGRKECVLVHRSDGSNCMYHLHAKLDDIDLNSYPLLSQARIWKTVVGPGEILLMPHGTYHQCRNLSPCLSYSRFHLDTVNLRAFLQSMIDGDAPELDHDEILWNCTTDMMKKVDDLVEDTQSRILSNPPTPVCPLDSDIIKIVTALRSLRHIVREVDRRDAMRRAVKSKQLESGVHCLGLNPTMNSYQRFSESLPVGDLAEHVKNGADPDHAWDNLLGDLDTCLHEFRYRNFKKIPALHPLEKGL